MRQNGKKKRGRQDSASLAGTSQFDITGTFTKNDYFSDVNPRSMRRLLNIVAVTGTLVLYFLRSPDLKGHVSYCHHMTSLNLNFLKNLLL